mmetsp:Transcript_164823/g.523967  ORF Transcript_164823/g.523967 Transcript_164823/m.523967 type:complete len:483 (+) Transcript_164823:63-1511(+)
MRNRNVLLGCSALLAVAAAYEHSAAETCTFDSDASCAARTVGDSEADETPLLQLRASGNLEVDSHVNRSYTYEVEKVTAFAALVKFTYCSAAEGVAKSLAATCGSSSDPTAGNKGYCELAGVRIHSSAVRTILMADGNSSQALSGFVGRMVATADNPKVQPGCVFAIRGTWEDTNNYLRNQQIQLVKSAYGDCTECLVHSGYQEVWKLLEPAAQNLFDALNCTKQDPLYLMGHSMGGAVATMGMYALKTQGWNIQPSITFSSPHTGNQAFVQELQRLVGGSTDAVAVVRVTLGKDLVPITPRKGDYAFTWPEVYFSSKTDAKAMKLCWNTSCGIAAQSSYCGMGACNDHLASPIAPNDNMAIFKDYVGACVGGLGAASNQNLPKVAQQDASQQMAWMAKAIQPKVAECDGDWQPAADCVKDFLYNGKWLKGCTTDGGDGTSAWCSLDEYYISKWNVCTPCDGKMKMQKPKSAYTRTGNWYNR